MTFGFAPSTNRVVRRQKPSQRYAWAVGLVLFACCLLPLRAASADTLARAHAAYSRGNYIGVVRMLNCYWIDRTSYCSSLRPGSTQGGH